MTKIKFEVWNGPQGKTLLIMNDRDRGGFRLAGPKIGVQGRILHEFEVDVDMLIEQIEHYKE